MKDGNQLDRAWNRRQSAKEDKRRDEEIKLLRQSTEVTLRNSIVGLLTAALTLIAVGVSAWMGFTSREAALASKEAVEEARKANESAVKANKLAMEISESTRKQAKEEQEVSSEAFRLQNRPWIGLQLSNLRLAVSAVGFYPMLWMDAKLENYGPTPATSVVIGGKVFAKEGYETASDAELTEACRVVENLDYETLHFHSISRYPANDVFPNSYVVVPLEFDIRNLKSPAVWLTVVVCAKYMALSGSHKHNGYARVIADLGNDQNPGWCPTYGIERLEEPQLRNFYLSEDLRAPDPGICLRPRNLLPTVE